MIYASYFWSRIFPVFISFSVITYSIDEPSYDYTSGDAIDEPALTTAESSTIYVANSTKRTPLSSSALILSVLTTNAVIVNSTVRDKISFSSLLVTSITALNSTSTVPSKTVSVGSLIDQVNSYRNDDIISHIQRCDPTMGLADMCEMYSIDKDTKLLTRPLDIEFETFGNLSKVLVDQLIVRRLNQFCSPNHWCARNLSRNDIDSTSRLIQKQGHFFCELEKCLFRLLTFIKSCPTLSRAHLSLPTVKLLPMLCTLFSDQQSWNSASCTKEIVRLLYILHAFWPQLETCFRNISSGLHGCTPECHAFILIFKNVEHQCNGNASFLSRVPAVAWYRSSILTRSCDQKNSSVNFHAVKNFFSSNVSNHRFHLKSISTLVFLVVITCCIIMSFALCVRSKSKRRIDDIYEYTRLHDPSFELTTSSGIPNSSSTINGAQQDGTPFNSHGRFRSPEHQHLLHVES